MVEGTSQGTMILIAIIIFGIFVVIAYWMFEDKMKTMIGSMFTEVEDIIGENLKSLKPGALPTKP